MIQVTKEHAYEKIKQLIERFSEYVKEYKRNGYNEHQTRVDYINPFFKVLGWDMDNEQGFAEAYREVIHEDKIKVGGATKAPDYGFTLFGQRKFFVDAKKPSVNIKDDLAPAYQVRRYGWSAHVPVSIVTDFEEFSIYDCTKRPKPTDKVSVSRIKYLTYDQYLDEFDFLWDVFAKENLPKGRFDKYVQSDTAKKGTATVDDEFLKSIEEWRKYLATTIALRNKTLHEDEINYAVQKTIDRIIFLRMCEDRGVESYGELKKAAETGNIYENLLRLYRTANEKYNSGLFDFNEDNITPYLTIDDKALKTIIRELYYPHCEYEFSVMPADILGSVYERFLGKTIRLTKGHSAKIEEKPEVRKAGGVYYTPKYVVDYIIQNTVGKLVEGKTPKQVEKIKICDPACGSGSFLIGAYQHLLDWHLKYYTVNPPGRKKESPLTPDGNLTTAGKKRILLNNIFGVDIDAQAVEVTRLNLSLKALEGETQASITQQVRLFHERVLPNLNHNIKCGNSLIGPDFYDDQLDLFPEQMKKINAFNWEQGFPEIFKQGGFDAVIGNPPWVDIKGLDPVKVDYYFHRYETASNRINLYSLFVERSLQILKDKGSFGFIIPNSILYQSSYEKIRQIILKDFYIPTLVRMPDNTFTGVKAESLVLTIEKKKCTNEKTTCIIYDRKDTILAISKENATDYREVNQNEWRENTYSAFDIFTNEKVPELLKKIEKDKITLDTICDFTLGITPYDKYKGHSQEQIDNKVFHSDHKKDKTFKELLAGADVTRYFVNWSGAQYLSYGNWLGAPREQRFFTRPRILVRQIVSGKPLRIYAGYTDKELYNTQSIFNIILKDNANYDLKFLLAILNSTLMNFYHSNKYLDLSKNLFQKILIQNCKKFPIPGQDGKINEIIQLVNNLLSLNDQLKATKLDTQRQQIQRAIDHTERKIDELVYELYGLNEGKIKIVEKAK
ncbi:MAG: N-6 DNA methylase [Bacteroidota bacterium]